ncbi:MAG TPA: Type 1 glutamine amidotransferase-like domain-containing protein [Candidatus Saccharimonadales bacterium]|nr:Type 1 glutamine amidotransferase-like domain-containing protein [Candidatus Saccharimonadales bacterium]
MKLLLTSQSITNKSIATALRELLGKPSKECTVVFITTSQNGAVGDKTWFIHNLNDAYNVGWKSFEIIDVAAMIDLPKAMWWDRIEQADVLFVGGGSNYYLGYWLERAGFAEALPELLKTKVYVSSSAGSMVTTHSIVTSSKSLKQIADGQPVDLENIGPEGQRSPRALGIVDILLRPHYTAAEYPYITDELLQRVATMYKRTLYAIDDNSALKVVDDSIEVISEGRWKRFEAEGAQT